MEALEVDDISPAVEATEDFFSIFDDNLSHDEVLQQNVCGIPEVRGVTSCSVLNDKGKRSVQGQLSNVAFTGTSNTVWELCGNNTLESQVQTAVCDNRLTVPRNTSSNHFALSAKEGESTLGIIRINQSRRLRPGSTNDADTDTLIHTKDGSGFQMRHARSHSDVVYSQQLFMSNSSVPQTASDSRIWCPRPAFPFIPDKSSNDAELSHGDKEYKDSFPNILKKGYLKVRLDSSSYWSSCYTELLPSELRQYFLDRSGNESHCATYHLSQFRTIRGMGCQDARVVDVVFVNNSMMQLKAASQWEARDWQQQLWGRVLTFQPDFGGYLDRIHPSESCNYNKEYNYESQDQLREPTQSADLPLNNKYYQNALISGVLYKCIDENTWKPFIFVLNESSLMTFLPDNTNEEPLVFYNISTCLSVGMDISHGCFQLLFPQDVLRLKAESQKQAQEWVDTIHSARSALVTSDQNTQVFLRNQTIWKQQGKALQKSKRQSVTTSFLSIFMDVAVEKGLTAQGFKCAGCQQPVGLSYGKAKVCSYSGWYYCDVCHVDDTFLIPARLVHNWDTARHKVSKQAKEFLEYIYEEPLIDILQENPTLYDHIESLETVHRLRRQLKSLRAYLFSCRAAVAEDLRRRISPREYLFQQIHLYSLADLQQVIEGKLAPYLMKIVKFASSHVYSCGLCHQKGFICEICTSRQIIYPFEDTATKRCEICGAVFHMECKSKTVPCPRCVRRELQKKQKSFWRRLNIDDTLEDACSMFELSYQNT